MLQPRQSQARHAEQGQTSLPNRFLLVILLVLVAGCDKGSEGHIAPGVRGPSLTLGDSLILVDSDSIQLGGYTAFITRSASGETYVNDMSNSRIVRFDSQGALVGVYGKRGAGPGELDLPSAIGMIADDSILAVFDVNLRRMSLFDVRTNLYLRRLAFSAQDIGQNWTEIGDTVFFPVHLGPSLIGAWVRQNDSILGLGHLPLRLNQAMPVYVRSGRSDAVVGDSGFVVLLPTEPGLYLLDSSGHPTGRVRIPSVRRRGEPPDLVERQLAELRAKHFGPIGSSSASLHQLSNGELAIVHYDVDFVGRYPAGRFENFRLYASLVSRDRSLACVDGLLPVGGTDPTFPIFVGDSMFILIRRVTPDDQVTSTVYNIRVSDVGCDWISTGGIRPPLESD